MLLIVCAAVKPALAEVHLIDPQIPDGEYIVYNLYSDNEKSMSLAGNDPSRLEEIKASIDEGFQQAALALGDTLPDISMKTNDAVMEKLDAWIEDDA